MSSIEEARERIGAASEEADKALAAIGSASEAVDEAFDLINQAAEGSGHEKIEEALRQYQECKEKLAEAVTLLHGARETADEYASNI